ncbi:MAG: putative high-affinity branched-chain amino acid transporter, amino acid-binding protein [Parcubacteria group bacterium]|nr:putative high-affinity branched-chain amino acid transporter, amino acid-binding protein [Parcubacteria group bacterium]
MQSNMKKSYWIALLVILVILGIWITKHKKSAPASLESIKIGAALTLSGDAAVWGEADRNGIQLAVKKINEDGGVKGRPLELIVEDSKSSSKDTISAVSKLQNVDKVKALLVSWLDVYQGAESILKPNTLMISPDAGTEGVNGVKIHPNVFSTWYRTQPKSELAIKHMAEHGKKRLYIITQNDSYFVTVLGFMEAAAKKYGVEIVGEEKLNAGTDIQSILTKVKAKNPDAVFYSLYDEKENIDFLKKNKSLLDPSVSIYGDELVQQNYTRTDYDQKWFEGFYFYGPKSPNPMFSKLYKETYGKDPIFGASVAYDSVFMIAKALEDEPADLNSYMRQTKFKTVSYGTVTFDEIGGIETPEDYFVMKQIKNGVAVDAN